MKTASKDDKAASSVAGRSRKVLVLHGPNLNLLGSREPEIYGAETLPDINKRLAALALKAGAKLDSFQSNSEAELIERVQKAGPAGVDFVIINPAAFTHTSVALRDALAAVRIPYIEVHLSNVHAREPFRHHSYFSDQAVGVICGLGSRGYEYALQSALIYSARKK
jgi:3-dehydroquinate dehydratase-2